MDTTQSQAMQSQLRIAHDKLMQAQQKIDNADLAEQKLLQQALDAVNAAQTALQGMAQYTYMNE